MKLFIKKRTPCSITTKFVKICCIRDDLLEFLNNYLNDLENIYFMSKFIQKNKPVLRHNNKKS